LVVLLWRAILGWTRRLWRRRRWRGAIVKYVVVVWNKSTFTSFL
jgi:hypothetical protein